MKIVLIIMLCITTLIVVFFIGKISVEPQPDSYVMYSINENFIPYIKEYIDVVGQKEENNKKKFITVSIHQKKNGHNLLIFRYNDYTDGVLLTTVQGVPLILENNNFRFLVKPNENWLLSYLATYSKKDYNIYKSRIDGMLNPICGSFDELEIITDLLGNVVSHRINFAELDDDLKYTLEQDSLNWKMRYEPTDDL